MNLPIDVKQYIRHYHFRQSQGPSNRQDWAKPKVRLGKTYHFFQDSDYELSESEVLVGLRIPYVFAENRDGFCVCVTFKLVSAFGEDET